MNPKKKKILKVLGLVYLVLVVIYLVVTVFMTGPHGGAKRRLDESLVANNAVLVAELPLRGSLELRPSVQYTLLRARATTVRSANEYTVLGALLGLGVDPTPLRNPETAYKVVVDPVLPAGTRLTHEVWAQVIEERFDTANPPMVEVKGMAGIMQFDLTLIFIMLNFLGLFVILYVALWDPVMAMLDKRAETIRTDLDTAAGRRQEAEDLKKKYNELMLSAKQERQTIINQGRHEGNLERERILSEARDDSAKVVAQTRLELEAEAGKVRTALRQEIGGLSLQVAERILGREVSKADNERLVAEFVDQVQKSDLRN
jgi:F-type H+-transporting ATPase subunit b